ncbi:MAG: hypothetical protein JNM90_24655 [Burkholderiales bacterium]|nr:hypothetical protein [Burkholderiales bacterium]
MRILFDQGAPVPLRRYLSRHEVVTAYERGWSRLTNGLLLDAAEADGFGLLITTDTNLRYQQSLAGRRIAIIVLATTSWPRIQRAADLVVQAVDSAMPGCFLEVPIP